MKIYVVKMIVRTKKSIILVQCSRDLEITLIVKPRLGTSASSECLTYILMLNLSRKSI